MADYIDRQAAIEALGKRPVVWDEWADEYTLGQRKQYDYNKLVIEALPSVEIESVKRGRWIYIKKKMLRGGYISASECSVCHKRIMPHFKPNYCPNCGAKMDEVEDNG